MVEIQLTFLMKIKVFILTIVQRQVRINFKCQQNLRKPPFFIVITPYIHKDHRQKVV